MDDRTPDFMLEEYKQIAHGYEDLHSQQNELVKFYLTLVAIPASILAVATQLVRPDAQGQVPLIGTITHLGVPILLFLLIGLVLVGLGVVLALVTTRAEALLYVRTVNGVRRYFVEKDPTGKLKRYLVLADFDTFPPFLEGLDTRAFWNVAIVAFMNSAVAASTCYSIFWWRVSIITSVDWFGSVIPGDVWMGQSGLGISFLFGVLWFVLQVILRRTLLTRTEQRYQVHFPSPFPSEKRLGVDLDGVLGDLAGAVIEKARTMFGMNILRSEITCHRLQDCTKLSGDQVKQIFESDIFQTLEPEFGAVEALKTLRRKGWVVHIITDRFWGREDWKTAKRWLEQYGFEWDHLNVVRAQDKADYAQTLRISTFIEDNYDTAKALASVCERAYLIEAPYNQGALPENVVRVYGWSDILKRIETSGGQLPIQTKTNEFSGSAMQRASSRAS